MNQARALLLLAICAYFVWQFWPAFSQGKATNRPSKVETANAIKPCNTQIDAIVSGGDEVRLQVRGSAERLAVLWPGGSTNVATQQVCSGGECRVKVPPNTQGVAVQFDGCPVVQLP